MSVRERWLGKAATARHWAAVWRRRYMANPTRHAKWKLEQWRSKEAYAERVVARHTMPTGISDKGLELIKGFEGFARTRDNPNLAFPYQDAVGVWTIGYGETAGIGPRTPPWTRTKAANRLKERVNRDYMKPVLNAAKAAKLRLTQNEADALASLVYNVGPGVLNRGRTMGDALRSRNRNQIANSFLVYDHAGGRRLEGLTRRRRRERQLFLDA